MQAREITAFFVRNRTQGVSDKEPSIAAQNVQDKEKTLGDSRDSSGELWSTRSSLSVDDFYLLSTSGLLGRP